MNKDDILKQMNETVANERAMIERQHNLAKELKGQYMAFIESGFSQKDAISLTHQYFEGLLDSILRRGNNE